MSELMTAKTAGLKPNPIIISSKVFCLKRKISEIAGPNRLYFSGKLGSIYIAHSPMMITLSVD